VPVVVTGANGFLGRATVRLQLAGGAEVRAVVRRRDSAEDLRALGAKVAVTRLDDTPTLATVMDGAHTVCHLAGNLDLPDEETYLKENAGTARDALAAAGEAGVTRILLVSYPGASPGSPNAYLRAKGLAEEAVRSSGLEHVILRCTHVYGPGSRWLAETASSARRPLAAVVVGAGSQRLAPVFVDDVARALAAADDRADRVEGTFALQGPDEVTADRLADLLAGRRRRKVHLSPGAARRTARFLGRRLSPTMLEILAGDSLSDAPDAAAEFGLRRIPLAEGLAASRPGRLEG
jgi:uncharacterized protein YbjT (DUF2867 family)